MHFKQMFPSPYLGAHDLKGDTKAIIEHVEPNVEIVGPDGKKEYKPVVTFKNAKKKFVLNKTNARVIARRLGSNETDDWINKEVTLYPTTCNAFGQEVECVRVR